MTVLRNLRQVQRDQGPAMSADFTAPDGRVGCVEVSLVMFEQCGERVLQEEADARVQQSKAHGYHPPQEDRYRELG